VSILSTCQCTCLFLSFYANLIVHFVQKLFCLSEGVSKDDALVVFNNSAQKLSRTPSSMLGTSQLPTTPGTS
jgi:hypothetical protein